MDIFTATEVNKKVKEKWNLISYIQNDWQDYFWRKISMKKKKSYCKTSSVLKRGDIISGNKTVEFGKSDFTL